MSEKKHDLLEAESLRLENLTLKRVMRVAEIQELDRQREQLAMTVFRRLNLSASEAHLEFTQDFKYVVEKEAHDGAGADDKQ